MSESFDKDALESLVGKTIKQARITGEDDDIFEITLYTSCGVEYRIASDLDGYLELEQVGKE